MRILFITDNFPPEVNAPASRTFEHCSEWVKLGHEVTVITCFPNFPNGKVYTGFSNNLRKIEHLDGIMVIRVWSYIAANQGFLPRILDYISFMVSATTQSLKLGHYDRIIGTSPQFFSAVASYLIGSLKSTPWIFELRDIWPESIQAVGAMKNSWLLDLFEQLELFLYERSHLIISVTHSFKKNLIQRKVPESKISVIINGVDLKRFYQRPKDDQLSTYFGLDQNFVAGYIGTHGMAHSLDTILDAAQIIQDMHDLRIKFVLLGSGAEKEQLVTNARKRNLDNIVFIDSVSKDEVPRYWSLLDVSIVHLRDAPLFKTVIPSKIFESMGMGIPIIHGVLGESAEIIKKDGVGWVVHPENPQEMANTIIEAYCNKRLLKTKSQNCWTAAQKYKRAVLATEMSTLISR